MVELIFIHCDVQLCQYKNDRTKLLRFEPWRLSKSVTYNNVRRRLKSAQFR